MMATLHLHQIIPTSNSAQCGHLLIVFIQGVTFLVFVRCVIILLYPEHFLDIMIKKKTRILFNSSILAGSCHV